MVRAPAHALPRSAGFALLKPASRPQLDSARIITMSGTIAINLIAFGLLMMPLSLPPPAVSLEEPKPAPTLRQIPEDPVVVDIVETLQPTSRETTRSVVPPVATTRNPSAESALVVDNGSEPVVDTVDNDTGPVGESITPIATGPSPMQLEYRLAPAPTYPRRALQQRLTGTVLLQVLVGIDGHPLEVKVAQSSGHRDLDEAARAQVLKRWSFQPASRNGQAVQAIGMVPIQFALQD